MPLEPEIKGTRTPGSGLGTDNYYNILELKTSGRQNQYKYLKEKCYGQDLSDRNGSDGPAYIDSLY